MLSSNKGHSGFSTFCLAVLLSPLIGLLIALAQTNKRREDIEQRRHQELLQVHSKGSIDEAQLAKIEAVKVEEERKRRLKIWWNP